MSAVPASKISTATVVELQQDIYPAKSHCKTVLGKIKLRLIDRGNNPRTYTDANEMTSLRLNIRAHGVLQPILIRKIGDGHRLIAGNRRYDNAELEFGLDYEIPCLILLDATDEDEAAFALIENVQRAPMSRSEEAEAAAKLLAWLNGDEAETAKVLSWSLETLKSRLALTNLIPEAKVALNERRINLGHAELLAATTHEIQGKALAAIIAQKITVPACKDMLARISKQLNKAVFDKKDCTACLHNSDHQTVLFSESIGGGCCTNGDCFDRKTEEELQLRRTNLVDDFPKVEIVRPGAQYTLIKLKAEGAKGVGNEQAKACRGCQNFGAAISATPDTLGDIAHDLCFDVNCHAEKVRSRVADEAAATQSAEEQAVDKNVSSTEPSVSKKGKPDKAAKPEKKPDVKGVPASKKAAKIQASSKVKEYRQGIWRKMARNTLHLQPKRNLNVLIALAAAHRISNVDSHKLSQALSKSTAAGKTPSTAKMSNFLSLTDKLTDAERNTVHLAIAASAMESVEEACLVDVLVYIEADITLHWKLDTEFLTLLTKSELEALADELGMRKVLGKDFPNVATEKKENLIKKLLGIEGFDYANAVPHVMQFGTH